MRYVIMLLECYLQTLTYGAPCTTCTTRTSRTAALACTCQRNAGLHLHVFGFATEWSCLKRRAVHTYARIVHDDLVERGVCRWLVCDVVRTAAEVLRLVLVGRIKRTWREQARLAIEPIAQALHRILWHARANGTRAAQVATPSHIVVVLVGRVGIAVPARGGTSTLHALHTCSSGRSTSPVWCALLCLASSSGVATFGSRRHNVCLNRVEVRKDGLQDKRAWH